MSRLRDRITLDPGPRWSDPPGCAFWIALVLLILACAWGLTELVVPW